MNSFIWGHCAGGYLDAFAFLAAVAVGLNVARYLNNIDWRSAALFFALGGMIGLVLTLDDGGNAKPWVTSDDIRGIFYDFRRIIAGGLGCWAGVSLSWCRRRARAVKLSKRSGLVGENNIVSEVE